MRAEIISIGTEVLLGETIDTNAAVLSDELSAAGAILGFRQTVDDDHDRIVAAMRLAMSRARLVVTIGGLGPTDDDRTRQAISEATGVAMFEDPVELERLQNYVRERGRKWLDKFGRQALVFENGHVIPNKVGTAPGLVCQAGKVTIVALPGPPRELEPMLKSVCEYVRGDPLVRRVLRVAGMPESEIEHRLGDVLHQSRPNVEPYAKTGEVLLRISARGADANRLVDIVAAQIISQLGDHVYGEGDKTLPEYVVERLRKRGDGLTTAESLTGGGLGALITSVPGASDVYMGGFVTYSDDVKRDWLNVSPKVLQTQTAVAAQVAREMAKGARKHSGAHWALSTTGYAGPEGSDVGLVYIGLAGRDHDEVQEYRFGGDRATIRERAQMTALLQLWRAINR